MASSCIKCLHSAARILPVLHVLKKYSIRGLTMYSKSEGVTRDFMALLQTPLTTDTVKYWYQKRQTKQFYEDQKFVKERHDILGPDLATAHFILARGGSVKFWGIDHWFEGANHNLPDRMVSGMFLEAVDASGTQLAYPAMDNFVNLKYLNYLDVSNCPYVDDWFLAKCYTLRDSLEVLDISGCLGISTEGIACLHHLRYLQSLNVSSLPQIEFKDITFLLLEEMLPQCHMVGVGFLPRGPDINYQKLLRSGNVLSTANINSIISDPSNTDVISDKKDLNVGEAQLTLTTKVSQITKALKSANNDQSSVSFNENITDSNVITTASIN